MKKFQVLLILAMVFSLFCQTADANSGSEDQSSSKEVKRALSYQSMVKDSLGNPIEDGKYLITFKLYDSENSNDHIWFENQNVYIFDGILNVLLGNKQRLRPEMFRNPLWVTLEMDGEESEKQYVSASSYSMYSGMVDLEAFAPSEDVHLSLDPDGRIVIDVIDIIDPIPSIYGDDWNFFTGGVNSWTFNTNDSGDWQRMCVTNTMYSSNSDWTKQTIFWENGDLEINGNIIGRKDINLTGTLNATNVNSRINASYFGLANSYMDKFDYMSFYDRDNNDIGSLMYNKNAKWYGGGIEADGITYDDFVIYARKGRDLVLKTDANPDDNTFGDVYVGSAGHTNDLRVNGKIYAKEVNVLLNVFPDYVFKDDYNLLSLSQVEDHINSHGYLPGMPSEKEVVENGLNLNDMQLKLVEKIEELTLHMIRIEKENKELRNMIESGVNKQ